MQRKACAYSRRAFFEHRQAPPTYALRSQMNHIFTPRLATQAEMEIMFGQDIAKASGSFYHCDFILNGVSHHLHATSAAEAEQSTTKVIMELARPDPSSTSKAS